CLRWSSPERSRRRGASGAWRERRRSAARACARAAAARRSSVRRPDRPVLKRARRPPRRSGRGGGASVRVPLMPLPRVRRHYRGRSLLESRPPPEPLALFRRWLTAALRSGGLEPTAMALATVDRAGRPRARMVLLKQAGPAGFTFYTNFASAKA